jgi:hypothetical protein
LSVTETRYESTFARPAVSWPMSNDGMAIAEDGPADD